MAARRFPVLKLPHVVLEKIINSCSIESILLVSTLSRKTELAIQQVPFLKEVVKVDFDSFKVRLQNHAAIEWKFEQSRDRVRQNPTFSKMVECARDNGGTVLCAQPRAALTMIFAKIMELFRIHDIPILNAYVTRENPSLQSDQILQGMRSCRALKLSLDHPVTNNDLDWLFQRVVIHKELGITATRTGLYNYQKPFSTVETVLYEGWLNAHSLEYKTLVNVTHIHMIDGSGYAANLNQLLRSWQQGLLPKLRIIEHGGLRVRAPHSQFTQLALEGIDTQEWDVTREGTFNQNLFFFYAPLRFHTKALRFRDAKDITRATDGMKASFIPVSRDPVQFVFVVWSDWIPVQYRRPSQTPYVPEL